MSENQKTVLEFVEAWNALDLDAILGSFTDDAVYHNMPMEPAKGIEAIRILVNGFAGMATEAKWTVHRIAETEDGSVLTERTDSFCVKGKWISLPVMGTFELRAGKISAWRDYFDMAQFQSQLPEA